MIHQTRWNTCGVAALKMIYDHFGINASLEELEDEVDPWERGISLLKLRRLAEERGLRAEGWKFDPAELPTVPFPAIFFVRGNHYVTADSFSAREGLYVRDPSCGRLLVRRDALFRSWRGESIIFHRR
ncbi:MAG: cysteine peptidase family C39 domain-containing protein [Ignavibacteriales bacterium]|nr:cysteine peptidase family C39 domain-containing protein [Ignavibacteriales bacterium]